LIQHDENERLEKTNGPAAQPGFSLLECAGACNIGSLSPLVLLEVVLKEQPESPMIEETPFTNSLGMTFVPAGTPGALFSVWLTRVADFEAFVGVTGHDAVNESSFGWVPRVLREPAQWKPGEEASWRKPGLFMTEQSAAHPVVCVSCLDAEAFCAWLTRKERTQGVLPATARYRLPTDSEWSTACGPGEFPWGDHYPPKSTDGNYWGEEAQVGAMEPICPSELAKTGFKDGFARTSPVGSFAANRYGLFDMGGNVFEWCGTWYESDLNDAATIERFPGFAKHTGGPMRVLRGASWFIGTRLELRSCYRNRGAPEYRDGNIGFRCILETAQ
jgi:formylglycine-generating enzyme required for sulfatase activity